MTPLHILIVEETALEAAVVEHILRRGADTQPVIATAHDLAAARAHLATHAIDIVLLNLVLPDWKLSTTLGFIAEHAPRVPIVVLSASADPVALAESLNALAQDYLIKWQFNAQDLWRSLRYAIERHRAAHELRRAKREAELANQAKSRFLATMSHEIRTPLGALLGMAELLEDSVLSAEQRRHLGLLHQAGQHLRALIDDVLDMGKIEAGALSLERVPFDPRDPVDGTVGLFRERAGAQGLALKVSVGADVPAFVQGDSHRLRQILINLVGNALKFTRLGQVELRLTAGADPGTLVFSVIDTGPGIPPDQHEAIFEPFVQAEASTARLHGGTGLGLAISRGLAGLMGGSLVISSPAGAGSCFALTLPLGSCLPSPAPSVSAALGAQARPLRLIIVEDAIPLKALFAAFVRTTLHEAEFFADGASALPRLERGDFDLLLLDLHLPGIDGFEVLRRLRGFEAASGRRPAPVIAMTADVLLGTRRRCEAVGFAGFLPKPIRRVDFMAAIAPFAPATGDDQASGPPHPGANPSAAPWDEDARALMPSYLKACRADIEAAEAAQDAADFAHQKSVGHRIKGSGATFGLPDVAAAAAALQSAAEATDATAARKALARLSTAIDAAEWTLAQLPA
jgi:signal transduction histidine kinase/HPt (histidine-containing phosphotransfer) domain-containing protein